MRQAATEFPAGSWRTSSYSGTQGNCVEVAHTLDVVGVRDTKNRDAGALLVAADAWRTFTTRL